jgi:hypothetical protein
MGTSARFYANDTSWIVGKKRQQFTAFEFLFNGFSISSQSKQMENMFCYIQANYAIVHFGLLITPVEKFSVWFIAPR